jgi:hypothetical protein
VLCRSLFVLLSFFFWSLCCLSFFDLRIMIAPLVSSSSSYYINDLPCALIYSRVSTMTSLIYCFTNCACSKWNCIGCIMVSVFAWGSVDRGLEHLYVTPKTINLVTLLSPLDTQHLGVRANQLLSRNYCLTSSDALRLMDGCFVCHNEKERWCKGSDNMSCIETLTTTHSKLLLISNFCKFFV